jgi:hypothetical protein
MGTKVLSCSSNMMKSGDFDQTEVPLTIPEPTGEAAPSRVKFDFIKSNFFRVVHADGAFGGIAPHGQIAMTLFSERMAIPQEVVHEVQSDQTLGPEIRSERKTRDAIVREVEVCAYMNIDVARAVRDWLSRHIQTLESLAEQKEAR